MELWLKILLSIVILLVVIGLFFGTYLLNKKTKAPADCAKDVIGCAGCMLQCQNREEDFNIKSLFTAKDKSIVPLEVVQPLNKKVLEQEQKKFIEEVFYNNNKNKK